MQRQYLPAFITSPVALAALFALVGCVDLKKPENVQHCSDSAQGCSDKADAAPGLDSAADVTGDVATPDLAADVADAGRDRVEPDAVDAITDSAKADTGPDAPKPDAAADLPSSPDLEGQDTAADEPERLDAEVVVDLRPSSDLPPVLDVTPDQTSVDVHTPTCLEVLKDNGYQAPPAPACSACYDNNTPMVDKCTKLIDCLIPLGSKAFVDCQNKVGAGSVAISCVTALTNAACPSGY